MSCFNCGGKGHVVKNYREGSVCRNCGMKGHAEIDCRVQNKGWTKSGVCEQPTNCPGQETVRCYPFKIHECTSHIRSNLDTIQLRVDLGKENKLTFLLNTGTDLSVTKRSSLQPGTNCSLKGGIKVKGTVNTVMKTEGPIMLKLFTDTHETTHTFHVVRKEFGIQYDGILGRNFFEDKQSIINYCNQRVIMGNVFVKCDTKPDKIKRKINSES